MIPSVIFLQTPNSPNLEVSSCYISVLWSDRVLNMNQISTVLKELQDDVVVERTSENRKKLLWLIGQLTVDRTVIPCSLSAVKLEEPKVEGKTLNKVYVQQKEYFLETTRDKLTSVLSGNEYQYPFSWSQLPLWDVIPFLI